MSLSKSSLDSVALGQAIDQISDGLGRILAGVSGLKAVFAPDDSADSLDLDPKDPANKQLVGGLEKLTPRGVEICYRLFDAGKTRYAVAQLMGISFGAATHRQNAWEKAGGIKRARKRLK